MGVVISKETFDSLMNATMDKLRATEALTVDDYIVLTRLYNTINYNGMQSEKITELAKLFSDEVMDQLLNALAARESSGGSFYSSRYKIAIGGRPDGNSMFRIIE